MSYPPLRKRAFGAGLLASGIGALAFAATLFAQGTPDRKDIPHLAPIPGGEVVCSAGQASDCGLSDGSRPAPSRIDARTVPGFPEIAADHRLPDGRLVLRGTRDNYRVESYRSDGTLAATAMGGPNGYGSITWWKSDGQFDKGYTAVYGDKSARSSRTSSRSAVKRSHVWAPNCSSNSSAYRGFSVPPGTTYWYTNAGTYPIYGSNTYATVLAALRGGHIEWNSNTNYCGVGDASALAFQWGGDTTAGQGADGISTVLWDGTAGGCGSTCLAAAYTYSAGETDIVFNLAFGWASTGSMSYYDIQSVMAHEAGHQIGLDHADTAQIMYYAMPLGFHHELGRGDANANNFLY